MRSVRRGIVTAALALPLAFGAAGVAAAGDGGEVEAQHASYDAKCAAAGNGGAAVNSISSDAGSYEHKDGKKHHKHDKDDGKARGDKYKHKHKEKSWAHFEKKGAAAGWDGAVVWKVESSAGHFEKG